MAGKHTENHSQSSDSKWTGTAMSKATIGYLRRPGLQSFRLAKQSCHFYRRLPTPARFQQNPK